MTRTTIKELLNKKRRTFTEDRELKELQNRFIAKSKVNPRLFDNNFEKTKQKFTGKDRREQGIKNVSK